MSAFAHQALQIAGALMILAAFAAAQARRMSTTSRVYLLLNVVGAGILAVLAYRSREWGFVLLETAWVGVSAWGLAQALRRAPDQAP